MVTVYWTVPAARVLPVTAGVAEAISYPALLMAALLLYVHTRVSADAGSAGVTTAMVFLTSQGIAYAVLRLALPDGTQQRPGWLMLLDLVVALLLVGLLAVPDRRRLPGDPLVVGLGLGVAISAVRLLLVTMFDPLPLLQNQIPWLNVVVLALYVVAAVLLVRGGSLPRRASRRLGVVLVLLGVGHTLASPLLAGGERSVVAVGADLAGTILFCVTAWALLQRTLRQSVRSEQLEELLELAEAEARQDRTVLHQVASAAAGISSASQLLASGALGDPNDRDRMVQMLAAESARLQRLSGRAPSERPREIDVDHTLAPLVAAQVARGRTLVWQPSGRRAVGSPDEVAEIVDILLENCADHSGTSTARLEVADRPDGAVDITVSDHGRGIERDVLARGFAWGSRGDESTGQGIGLHHAHELAARLGGSLAVTGYPGRGTSVTLTLPGTAAVLSRESRGA
ncbi:ATP-binding protein [Nocardioides sp.]|uniref:sensor histidine kinase n=1 Tax=Nocardioides sp. TaxID=35761 RepID=UPI002ED65CC3